MKTNENSTVRARYRRRVAWKRAILIVSVVALPIVLCVSISCGAVRIPLREIIAIFFAGAPRDENAAIILQARLPQALTALLAGAGLSVTGAATQAVLRNPLSSPFTLGVSSSAAFGAACVVVLGGANANAAAFASFFAKLGIPYGSVALGAFVCALLTTGGLLLLASKRRLKAETILLIGVALSAFYAAGTSLLQYVAEERQLAAIVYWTFGDAARGTWAVVRMLSVLVPTFGLWFYAQSWNYNATSLGEETARGLGVSVAKVRAATMFWAAFLTAILVATLGIIGFVGLIVPHFCRFLVGSDYRYLLPTAFFIGGAFLLISDTTARLVLSPRLVPVSILTAFVGAPIFLSTALKHGDSSC